MAAIISEKFRIFNAQQFLESLTEGTTDAGPDRSRMYFFIGRPQRWDAYLEIYSQNSTAFAVGDTVYVGANYGAATFRATVRSVYPNSLLLYGVGPSTASAPAAGATLKGYLGGSDTGATAVTGVYRYATEDVPPVPLDNQEELTSLYKDIIAAKRITSSYARSVVRRYNWDLVANPKFDMWKPDYSATPGGGGQIGKQTATGASSIADAKFYVMNNNYEVFKCLYNGESPANPTGQNASYEPKTTPSAGQGTYNSANGIYTEPSGTYVWKYLFTIPTDDVLRFLSTDFMPIVDSTNASRVATETLATNGAISHVLVKAVGANLPNGTHYAPVVGDGTGAKVQIIVSSGSITSVSVSQYGSGYSYGFVNLITGTGSGAAARGLFSDSALTSPVTVGATATGSVEAIMSPLGGHGSSMEQELNAKRVMTNIRLTQIESAGDFPVDNDFRRIGLIKDPYEFGTTTFATAETLNGLRALKISGATAGYTPDEIISQTVTGGTAKGTVVSWTLDSGSTTNGVLKYIQSPDLHTDNGVVRLFESNGSNAVTGASSLASGTVNTTYNASSGYLGAVFANGLAAPEIQPNSGSVIYIENRRLITRAADQIEDIKLVIEF